MRRASTSLGFSCDFPETNAELAVNFRTRLDPGGQLMVAGEPVPPIPPELQPWADASEDLSLASRLLE